jgi:hypothetical protein
VLLPGIWTTPIGVNLPVRGSTANSLIAELGAGGARPMDST